jgi:hypothetical protein
MDRFKKEAVLMALLLPAIIVVGAIAGWLVQAFWKLGH